MDKMEGLRAGVAEMRTVAQKLMVWADDLEASFQGPEAPERKAPAAGPKPAPKRKKGEGGRAADGGQAAEPAADEKAETPLKIEEVRAVLAEKCAAGYGARVKALIESYGAASLKGVPPERYRELVEAAESLGGETDAG